MYTEKRDCFFFESSVGMSEIVLICSKQEIRKQQAISSQHLTVTTTTSIQYVYHYSTNDSFQSLKKFNYKLPALLAHENT